MNLEKNEKMAISVENKEKEDTIGGITNEYRVIVDLIHEMDEQCKQLQISSETYVKKSLGLSEDIIDDILKYTKTDIEKDVECDELREFLKSYDINSSQKWEEMTEEQVREILIDVKNSSLVYLSAKCEAEKIKEQSSDIIDEYISYMSSNKVKELRERRIKMLEEAVEKESNEFEKRKVERMISAMKSAENFDYLEDRVKLYGKKELDSIKRSFFDDRQGSYVIKKYLSRIEKFGFNSDIYKYFLNIEETFLPEEYSPFNNLFLMIYMRMVAHSDPYDKTEKLFVQSLTSSIAKLVYHRFDNTESEKYFINVITHILDYFKDDKELFITENTTYEFHPLRIEHDKDMEESNKQNIIEKMNKMGIKNFDTNASFKELCDFYNERVDNMIKTQVEEFDNQSKEDEMSNDDSLLVDDANDDESHQVIE